MGVSLTRSWNACCQNCAMTNEQSYELWKIRFRKDCESEGKLPAFNSLGEYTLKLLWGSGLAPTVRAIVGNIDGFRLNCAKALETDRLAPQSAPEINKP